MIEINETTRAFINAHREDDVNEMALRGSKNKDLNLPLALMQIEGWQKARKKLPSWSNNPNIIYPTRIALEQCSSEYTANYKQELMSEKGGVFDRMVDLTGGFGVDTVMLGQLFEQVIYVEEKDALCEIASRNFATIGMRHVRVLHGDSMQYFQSMEPCNLIYIDPSRRNDNGYKMVSIEDCEPNVRRILYPLLEKADTVMIKLSPMHDIIEAVRSLFGQVEEVHVISVDNECKELLLLASRMERKDYVKVVTVNISTKGLKTQVVSGILEDSFSRATHNIAMSLGKYMYEPNASLMKARLFKPMVNRWPVEKLHTFTHLFTSDQLYPDFPGLIYEVEHVDDFSREGVRRIMNGVEKAAVKARNFYLDSKDLRERLRVKDGDETCIYGVTMGEDKKVLIRCKKVVPPRIELGSKV